MKIESFNQPPPVLGNQYDDDRVLRTYLERNIPPDMLAEMEPTLQEMGELSGGALYNFQLADRLNEPVLTQWDAWGERIDHIEVTPLWKEAERLAAKYGVVAAAYEQAYGRFSRIYQFALAYLFHPSTDVYSCPLAMSDGAARTLLNSNNKQLIARALPHLTSRDPQQFWTSGQWMTESTGGSDVGLSETTARRDEDGVWRLYGRKWFTSATTSQIALTLARPEGNPPGGRGLAMFYLELRDGQGRLQNIHVNRLKDKLGTRKVPTAELSLEGTPAIPVQGLSHGTRSIVPMLHLTRTWNAVTSAAVMRRGLALARSYAGRRFAFGAALAEQPLHQDTLARMQASSEAAFHLSFYLVDLIGQDETGQLSAEEKALLRLLTSLTKLTTGKQAVAVSSEILESFGGAGYVEDTGLPLLLRDAQVLPIWEGTTNVLSLDVLRALYKEEGLEMLQRKAARCIAETREPALVACGKMAEEAIEHAFAWLQKANQSGREVVEAGARRFALTLGRALQLALLVEHAQWSLDNQKDDRARTAARYFAQAKIDHIIHFDLDDLAAYANDHPLQLEIIR
ncbi:MAG: acyl-CoA dehydrogenase family protein [Candidatus Promineifilaceae bacterium]|nr:acyl-CoA dehydrogenase family protein [Candidatus Promineifilaceae bacterium]